jgi:hypothetical protein
MQELELQAEKQCQLVEQLEAQVGQYESEQGGVQQVLERSTLFFDRNETASREFFSELELKVKQELRDERRASRMQRSCSPRPPTPTSIPASSPAPSYISHSPPATPSPMAPFTIAFPPATPSPTGPFTIAFPPATSPHMITLSPATAPDTSSPQPSPLAAPPLAMASNHRRHRRRSHAKASWFSWLLLGSLFVLWSQRAFLATYTPPTGTTELVSYNQLSSVTIFNLTPSDAGLDTTFNIQRAYPTPAATDLVVYSLYSIYDDSCSAIRGRHDVRVSFARRDQIAWRVRARDQQQLSDSRHRCPTLCRGHPTISQGHFPPTVVPTPNDHHRGSHLVLPLHCRSRTRRSQA